MMTSTVGSLNHASPVHIGSRMVSRRVACLNCGRTSGCARVRCLVTHTQRERTAVRHHFSLAVHDLASVGNLDGVLGLVGRHVGDGE